MPMRQMQWKSNLAQRHFQNLQDEEFLTRPSPVKKVRKTFEEPECLTLEPLVEYEELKEKFPHSPILHYACTSY